MEKSNGSITISGALTLVFITLKLTHVIDWSWLWVLSPAWIPLAIVVAVLVIVIIVAFICSIFDTARTRRQQKKVAEMKAKWPDKDVIMVGDTCVYKRQVAENKFGIKADS